jgi:ribonuclease D
MLAYAQMDTHYLLRLRDEMTAELIDNDCLTEALEIFADQCHIELSDNKFKPDDFWSINGTRDLSPQKRALVKALFIYRDQQARRLNRPPFKVFNNRTIVELAEAAPRYLEELSHIHGMSAGQIRRYGRSILRVIAQARHDPPPKRVKSRTRPPDNVTTRYERLHNWRKSKARERGVESDVIISRSALWTLAWANPRTVADMKDMEKVGPWRRKAYGPEILALLDDLQTR